MNEEKFNEIWQPVNSIINYLNMNYDEAVIIGSQFGKLKEIIKEQQERLEKLDDAEDLLSRARNIMDEVHLYNSDIYKDIGIFLYGEEEE